MYKNNTVYFPFPTNKIFNVFLETYRVFSNKKKARITTERFVIVLLIK